MKTNHHGINLREAAADAVIGSPNNLTVISGHNGMGIVSAAPRTQIVNTYVGLNAEGEVAPNAFFGVYLESTAIDARIGAEPLNECSRAGYMMCTTSTCCKEVLMAGDIDRIITEKDECIAAAKAFQRSTRQSITSFSNLEGELNQFSTFQGPGDFGPLNPFGCYIYEEKLAINTNEDAKARMHLNGACGENWMSVANCSTFEDDGVVKSRDPPAPYYQPLIKCDAPTGDSPSPVYVSGNLAGGILAEAPSLTMAC